MSIYLIYYLAAIGAICVIWYAIDMFEDKTKAEPPGLVFELFMCSLIVLAIPVYFAWRIAGVFGSLFRILRGGK